MAHAMEGWVTIPSGYDVCFERGIPVEVSDNGKGPAAQSLADEIAALCGLRVTIGNWSRADDADEQLAPITVAREDMAEVLRRLALVSAAVFVDRYNKPIHTRDFDWDAEEYAVDFNIALKCCGLGWGDVDKEAYFHGYAEAMHEESRRLTAGRERPIVGAE